MKRYAVSPDADRQQLIAVLELVKQQPRVAQSPVSQTTTETSRTVYTGEPVSPQARRSERLGRGDIDTLAAQLMMAEKALQKPGLTKQTIYKWMGGISYTAVSHLHQNIFMPRLEIRNVLLMYIKIAVKALP